MRKTLCYYMGRWSWAWVLLLTGAALTARAQFGDVCPDAVAIAPVTSDNVFACADPSGPTYTTADKAASVALADLACSGPATPDMWFAFVASEATAQVTLFAQTVVTPQLTLPFPNFTVYDACGGDALLCGDNTVTGVVTATTDELTPGDTYYVRVSSGQPGAAGTFKLCVAESARADRAEADCGTGRVLCSVPDAPLPQAGTVGAGADVDEFPATGCVANFAGAGAPDFGAVWYKWTVAEAGRLVFEIAPTIEQIDSDFDFVLYELPGGVDDCDDKVELRCMLNGPTIGDDGVVTTDNCLGRTGLVVGDGDVFEAAGCDARAGENYLEAADLAAGSAYALVVFNANRTGQGFTIDFAGTTATFAGGDPGDVAIDVASSGGDCVNDEFVITAEVDLNFDFAWDFGPAATPSTSDRPVNVVSFDAAAGGSQEIALTVTSPDGCATSLATTVDNISPDVSFLPGVSATAESCVGAGDGTVTLATDRPDQTYVYTLEGVGTRDDPEFTGLPAGDYDFAIAVAGTDCVVENQANGAPATVGEGLPAPPTPSAAPSPAPSCARSRDGAIAIAVEAPNLRYSVDGGGSFQDAPLFEDLPPGEYTLIAENTFGCPSASAAFTLEADGDGLDLAFPTPTPATCPGADDGVILPPPGTPDLTHSVDGAPFSTDLPGLAPGEYVVASENPQGCTALDTVVVGVGEGFDVEVAGETAVGFGEAVTLEAAASEAAEGALAYLWTLPDGQTVADVNPLTLAAESDGAVEVLVTDERGCESRASAEVRIVQSRAVGAPTAFSPNNDGRNDRWIVYGGTDVLAIRQLRVFDRWGGLMFVGLDLPTGSEDDGWDGSFRGEACQPGVYTYVAELELRGGEVRTVTGEINLML